MTSNQNDKQDKEIELFKNQYPKKIKNEDLEQFMHDAAELGKKLELKKIEGELIKKCLMEKIDFSDPKNMQYLLPLLPEFIFECSNPNSEALDATEQKKTIPMNNFNIFLYKIIDNREADSIDDVLREIVSLTFLLDEQNKGASACGNAMNFVQELLKNRSEFQFEVVLAIRLMAILINSCYVPEKIILKILNPARYNEPYIRKNQYIAIKEILSRAGTQSSNSDFKVIPYDHQIFKSIITKFLNKVSLINSYEKLKKIDELNQIMAKESDHDNKIEIKKWNNIIIFERNSKVESIYEFDQWVQCQFINLLPYVYEIIENNPQYKIKSKYLKKNKFPNLKRLSWNVQFSFLNMLRSSKKVLVESGHILADFFYRSTVNSDFQTACILAIVDFFEEINKLENEEIDKPENDEIIKLENEEINKLEKVQQKVEKLLQAKAPQISIYDNKVRNFFNFLHKETGDKLKRINEILKTPDNNVEKNQKEFQQKLSYIFKVVPIFTSMMLYYFQNINDNQKKIEKIFLLMNQLPINGRPNCCRIFLDPFFKNIPYIDQKSVENKKKGADIYQRVDESFKIAQNALQILLNSEDDFDDRLFYIRLVNYFYDSNNKRFKERSILMIDPLLDLISNDPVYVVRDYAVQTVLKLLTDSTFPAVLNYVQQIFPSASLNGKKSLLSLIASMISSIDPFESQEVKDSLFENYIDQIFIIINENKNRDLKRFFKDILKSIWTLLPEGTQIQFSDLFSEEILNKKDDK